VALAGETITYQSANENQTVGNLSRDAIVNNATERSAPEAYTNPMHFVETTLSANDRRDEFGKSRPSYNWDQLKRGLAFHGPWPREAG
jgi:hypothetical protein